MGAIAAAGFIGSLVVLMAPERPLQSEIVAATDHSPPFQIVYPDGRIGGAVVDALNIAAQRAGIRIHWKHLEVRPDDVLRDLDSGVDLWPMVTTTPDRASAYHFTQPIGRAEFLIAAIHHDHLDLRQFRPKRVALTAGHWLQRKLAEDFPDATPVVVKSGQQLTTLCEGRADALIADAASLNSMSLSHPPSCSGKQLANRLLLGWYWDLAIGSTVARSAEADRIRAEFGYLARTGALHEVFADYPIQAQYRSHDTFAETRSEQEARRSRWMLIALCVCCLALLGLVVETHRRTAQAMRLVKLKSEFLDRMSHELRTPLNGVLGLASLLATTPLNSQQRDYLRLIRQSGEQLLKLVSDSLAFSRLSARKHDTRSEVFCPRKLVEDTVAVLATLAQDRGIDLVWVVDRQVPRWVRGDESAVRQLLINLTGNAIKYTASGAIRVSMGVLSAGATFPFLRCEVDDSGPGVPKEDRTRIFDSFVRLNRPADNHAVGTGLGLAIAKELIILLNGRIGVGDSSYGGARFWFEFPVEPAEPAAVHLESQIPVRVLTPTATQNDPILSAIHSPPSEAETATPSTQTDTALPLIHLVLDLPGNRCQHTNLPLPPASVAAIQNLPDDQESPDFRHSQRNQHALARNLRRLALATHNGQPQPDRRNSCATTPTSGTPAGCWTETMEMLSQFLDLSQSPYAIRYRLSDAITQADESTAPGLVVLEGPLPEQNLASIIVELRKAYQRPRLPVLVYCSSRGSHSGPTAVRSQTLLLPRPFLAARFTEAVQQLQQQPRESDSVTGFLFEGNASSSPVQSVHDTPERAAYSLPTPSQRIPRPSPFDGTPFNRDLPVLVADDNPVNRLVLVSVLRSLGLEAIEAVDGNAALAISAANRFGLLVLDHHMPNLDGLACARALRSGDDWRRDVPIIVCSATNLSQYHQEYIDAGANAVLPKPFTTRQLQDAIHAAVHQVPTPVSGSGPPHPDGTSHPMEPHVR